MTISLFSGQGSQYPGMGRDILDAFPAFGNIYDTGSEILGRDLRELCFDLPPEDLARTVNAQPAVMTTSILCLLAAHDRGFAFEGVAGHSLGEYAAMYASGVVSLEDAFRLIKARCEAMDEAAREHKGAMAAVMKIAPEKVAEVCDNAKNYVAAVNYNSPMQTVIAGTPEGVEEVTPIFAEMKARVVPLNVAGAFHSKLMQSAADKFYEAAKAVKFSTPNVKYYSNVTGGELTDFSDMPALLAKHIVSPVRFTDELAAMSQAGADIFVEFGPGKTLTGLVKKTLDGAAAYNIENMETLDKLSV
ncbi:MAG: ACP S-malonyltransferase [Ruminococcus sp.]|nr:ACP S-malonyltransferase [Ruminococcus sp.]